MKIVSILILILLSSCNINPGDQDCGDATCDQPPQQGDRGDRGERDQDIVDQELEFEKTATSLINDYRQQNGKALLKFDRAIYTQVERHSRDMAGELGLTHDGFKRRIVEIQAQTRESIIKSGENIAFNKTATGAFNGWKRSLGHRRNMLGDFTHAAVGVYKKDNGYFYFTQIFIKK